MRVEAIDPYTLEEVLASFGEIGAWLDRAAEAENGVEVSYYAPDEGALMWFDQMAIPVDAPNPDGAHVFLNFIMDAQNMADASNYVYYANGNLASQPLLEEDVIGDPAIYPDAAAMASTYTTTPYPARVQRTVTRLWTRYFRISSSDRGRSSRRRSWASPMPARSSRMQ